MTNNAARTLFHNHLKYFPANSSQDVSAETGITICPAYFDVAPGQSCILKLNVFGNIDGKNPDPYDHIFICSLSDALCAGTPVALNVRQNMLDKIVLSPTITSLAINTSQRFNATGIYVSGVRTDISKEVSWSSSQRNVATIDSEGLVFAAAAGTTTITASLFSKMNSTPLSASSILNTRTSALQTITISPSAATISLDSTQQYMATGNYADGSSQDITASVIWASDTPTVATISNTSNTKGLASPLQIGMTTISASTQNITSNLTSQLTVSGITLTSVTISPDYSFIYTGQTETYTATGNYSDAST